MSHAHRAAVLWQRREGDDFLRQRYSRAHVLRFDGGAEVPVSAAPSSVPLPWSDAAAVDPEEMFVASLSSCRMLWFLALAAKAGFSVARYGDEAVGTMTPNAQGKWWVSAVTLRPAVSFGGPCRPTATELAALHHRAHEECFIASSVKTEVRVQPR